MNIRHGKFRHETLATWDCSDPLSLAHLLFSPPPPTRLIMAPPDKETLERLTSADDGYDKDDALEVRKSF